jgi:hypothetical protein
MIKRYFYTDALAAACNWKYHGFKFIDALIVELGKEKAA